MVLIMLRKKPVKTHLTRKKEDGIAISDHQLEV
jgi:hypothetical protein